MSPFFRERQIKKHKIHNILHMYSIYIIYIYIIYIYIYISKYIYFYLFMMTYKYRTTKSKTNSSTNGFKRYSVHFPCHFLIPLWVHRGLKGRMPSQPSQVSHSVAECDECEATFVGDWRTASRCEIVPRFRKLGRFMNLT